LIQSEVKVLFLVLPSFSKALVQQARCMMCQKRPSLLKNRLAPVIAAQCVSNLAFSSTASDHISSAYALVAAFAQPDSTFSTSASLFGTLRYNNIRPAHF
jgi:hypothetical protein